MKKYIFPSKTYRRIFITNSLIIIFILLLLGGYSINKIKNNVKAEQLYLNEKIIQDINKWIDYQNVYAKNIVNSLYLDKSYLNDIIKYLDSPIDEYLAFKLDNYLESNKSIYKGVEDMVNSAFQGNESIDNISIYSSEKEELNIFSRVDSMGKYYFDINKQNKNITIESFIKNSINENNVNFDKGKYNININLNDPNNLELLGVLTVTVNMNNIDNIIANYGKVNSNITLIDSYEKIIYDSKYDRVGKTYTYKEKYINIYNSIQLYEDAYVDINVNKSGIIILGEVNEKSINTLTFNVRATIIIVGFFLFVLAEIILFFRFNSFDKRTNMLITAMEEVKKGNLEVILPVSNEKDEINLITENFTDMCSRLDSYIKMSYIAEIKQKKAEFIALQNQINPHFLYNTLESIRMKAICNGDNEVGRAIYNLATIFRAQVKGNSNISIAEEINYTKMYLQLYKFRYEEKLNFSFNYDDEILSKEILKFSLQPLVENYLIHGFDFDREDNFLGINLKKKGEEIQIEIIDNGIGIEKEKLIELKERIKICEYDGKSIGLINVNERIKLAYGEQYGISIKKAEPIGIVVTLKIPCKEVKENV